MTPSTRVDLAGRLETIPFTELLQFLDQTRRRGLITLLSSSGEQAHCALVEGGLVQARLGHLRDREAVIGMLGWRKGRFEFTEDTAIPSHDVPVPVLPLVMEVARLEDELERLVGSGPDDLAKLVLRSPADTPDDPLDTGVHVVFAALASRPSVVVADLIQGLALAPIKVRLAVAWLGAAGHLRTRTSMGAAALRPAVPVADWYGELLASYPTGLRVLIASSPALSSQELAAMVARLTEALHAQPSHLSVASDGPSMVRIRPPAGGLLSLTFLPMKAKHRVLFETFARTADFVLITEACAAAELSGWEADSPLHIPRGMLPGVGTPTTILDALVAFAKTRSARRQRRG
jgi:hypothetical protein